MTTSKVNLENLDSQLETPNYADDEVGKDLLKHAQEAQSQQAALLDNASLEARYNKALAQHIEAKYEQVERLEDRLQNLIEQEMANLADHEAHKPAGLLLKPRVRKAWERARRQSATQRLQNRLERVREIKEEMSLHDTKIEELAARKLRLKEPYLTGEWDDMRTTQRHREIMERQNRKQPPLKPSVRIQSLNVVPKLL